METVCTMVRQFLRMFITNFVVFQEFTNSSLNVREIWRNYWVKGKVVTSPEPLVNAEFFLKSPLFFLVPLFIFSIHSYNFFWVKYLHRRIPWWRHPPSCSPSWRTDVWSVAHSTGRGHWNPGVREWRSGGWTHALSARVWWAGFWDLGKTRS